MKIYQQLGHHVLPKLGDVGIEIEVEGENLLEVQNAEWRTEDDPSLRGNYPDSRAEYVFKTPLTLDKAEKALVNLKKKLANAELKFSFRTSVHCHVNVLDLDHKQLCNMIYTYLLLEIPLMSYCGEVRKANRFCLRLVDAEGLLYYVSNLFQRNIKYAMGLRENDIRYAAMNLAALRKYGSLEFRGMRGTMDTNVLMTWAKTLVRLRDWACEQESPYAITKILQEEGAQGFMEHVLGDLAHNFITDRVEDEVGLAHSLTFSLPTDYSEGRINEARLIEKNAAALKRMQDIANGGLPKMQGMRAGDVIMDDMVYMAPPRMGGQAMPRAIDWPAFQIQPDIVGN